MATKRSNQWYENQKTRDQESRELSESLLGPEKAIFIEVMCLLALRLDSVMATDYAPGPLDELAFKRKISLAHYGFNLLWSAWDEALAGRYHTATNHWRSIDESSDFLLALEFNPQLADDMTDTTRVKIEAARRAIKKGLEQSGPAKIPDLVREMRNATQFLQDLSHISVSSLGQYLPVREKEGGLEAVVRLGGAVSQFMLRHVAISISISALKFLMDATGAFYDVVHAEHELEMNMLHKMREFSAALRREREALHDKAPGPVTNIYFARSDEELGSDPAHV